MSGSKMSQKILLMASAPLWMFGLWGSLKIHTLDLHLGHSICGRWGCGPPAEALLGYHAFWFVLLLPIAIGLAAFLTPAANRNFGWVLFLVGVATIMVIAGGDTYRFCQTPGNGQYLIQKFLFSTATKIDIPMLQIAATGLGLAWYGRKSRG